MRVRQTATASSRTSSWTRMPSRRAAWRKAPATTTTRPSTASQRTEPGAAAAATATAPTWIMPMATARLRRPRGAAST
eukprot:15468381-Alexandrium_andersonii.AAC.1